MIVSLCLVFVLFLLFLLLCLELVLIFLCFDFLFYVYFFISLCSILFNYTKEHKITSIGILQPVAIAMVISITFLVDFV